MMLAIRPLAGRGVFVDDNEIAALVRVEARERVGKLAPAREGHEQEITLAMEGNMPAGMKRLAGMPHGFNRRPVDIAPKFVGCRVSVAPSYLVTIDLAIRCRVIRGELPIGANPAH